MPIMLPALPEKYYLAHANELFRSVLNQHAQLLGREHEEYIDGYYSLSEESQALLVRFLSRKPKFISRHSLQYPEISDIPKAIEELIKAGYLGQPTIADWQSLSITLTKAQLLEGITNQGIKVKAATAKSELLDLATHAIKGEALNHFIRNQPILVRRQQASIDYIFFLFFGDLRNRFQKFAMRDLGVLNTRQSSANKAPRFDCYADARSAFELQLLKRQLSQAKDVELFDIAEQLESRDPHGILAQQLWDKLIVAVGEKLKPIDECRARKLWERSKHPKAIEKWIRSSYAAGNESVKHRLEKIQQSEVCAETQVFVEDFYARKYLGQRTGVYTQMLRDSTRQIDIDEIYLGGVEAGVVEHYGRRNKTALFVENKLWRVLFAFTFWDLLFSSSTAQHSEFDRLPPRLRDNSFYPVHKDAIETILASFADPEPLLRRFTQLAAMRYGFATGLFRWTSDLLDPVHQLMRHAPASATAEILRNMAKDFRNNRDGYPDLMVVDNGKLEFEEVKSPGDVLRANQLVRIQKMRQAGFKVEICQIRWAVDPTQVYSVVDIETTGGRKGPNAITEIAVVKVQDQSIVDSWSSLVNPCRPIPAHIVRLTGINNQMVADAPLFSEIAEQLKQHLEGSIFVAHNVGFDYGFIKSAYQHLNQKFRLPKYCTVKNARKVFPGLASYSLGNLAQHFDIDLKNAHRALADATATAHLLRLLQAHQSTTEHSSSGIISNASGN